MRNVLFSVATSLGLFTFTACADLGDLELSGEEIAEIVEAAMSYTNGGLANQVEELSEKIEELTLEDVCDSVFIDTFEYGFQGTGRQAEAILGWEIDFTCNSFSLPTTAAVSSTSDILYSSTRISGDVTADLNMDVSGLEPLGTVLVWNGTYRSSGSQDLNFRQQNTVSTVFQCTLVNVEVGKQSQKIESGSGTFTLDVTQGGTTTPYTGTITFNGDDTATLIINGTSYTINLR